MKISWKIQFLSQKIDFSWKMPNYARKRAENSKEMLKISILVKKSIKNSFKNQFFKQKPASVDFFDKISCFLSFFWNFEISEKKIRFSAENWSESDGNQQKSVYFHFKNKEITTIMEI